MPGPVFLEGDRIELRTVEEEDLDFLQTTINDPAVRRYLASRSPINGQQEQEWYEERCSNDENINLLICRDGEPMGTVGLHPKDDAGVSTEIGIFLAEPFWGEGYGTEASRVITDFAFRERRNHRVVARVFEGNVGSSRIWEKLGFRHEGTHVEAEFIDGEYVDIEFYAITEDEWFDREA
ncbi:GNAT family N-acetyltransferase [Haladaptatus sp. NG-SE-30]